MTRAEFNDAVESYCQRFACSETSGRRTVRRNAALKGVEHSPHLFGLGRDVVPDVAGDVATYVDVAKRLGLLVLIRPDHHHLQPLDWKPG